jgi:hypothetical protein
MTRHTPATLVAALLSAALLPPPVQTAAPPRARPPVAVLTARSGDALLAAYRLFAPVAGEEAQVKQLDDLLRKARGKGLEGVDWTRPWAIAIYWPDRAGGPIFDVNEVVLVPVADQERFLALLKHLGFEPRKAAAGLYRFRPAGGAEYTLRFARGYAHASTRPDLLRADLPSPTPPPADRRVALWASFHPRLLPPVLPRLAEQVVAGVLAAYQKAEGLDPRAAADLAKLPRALAEGIDSLIKQIVEITVTLTLDEKAGRVALEVVLRPQPGSAMATFCAYAGRARSRFVRLPPRTSLSLRVHFPPGRSGRLLPLKALPPQVRQFVPGRDRPAVLKLLQTLAGTIEADGLDYCLLLLPVRAASGQTFLFGLKVRHGHKLDLLVRDVVRGLPALPRKRFRVSWNHARLGGARVHKVEVFGEALKVLVAIRDDVVFLTETGADGQKALADVLALPLAKSPPRTPLLEARLSSGLFLGSEANRKAFHKIAPKLHARLTLTGGTDLRLRLETTTLLLKLLPALENAP